MKSITKCIIPAAGLGTRFLPATKSTPKEMLPIVDKPVIEYLVEEAVSAGITDIIIITHRSKKNLEDHFDTSYELESILEKKWKTKELESIQKISKLANFYFIRQNEPKGDWDAILRAEKIIGNEPCLVLFGDDLILGDTSGAKQLVEVYNNTGNPVIAVEEVSDNKVSSYGIVEYHEEQAENSIYSVTKFLEKPKPTDTSSRLGVIGKYIITPEILDALKSGAGSASKDWEIRLADAFDAYLKNNGKISAKKIEWIRFDTGDKLGYLKATIEYGLRHKDIGEDFKAYLQERSQAL